LASRGKKGTAHRKKSQRILACTEGLKRSGGGKQVERGDTEVRGGALKRKKRPAKKRSSRGGLKPWKRRSGTIREKKVPPTKGGGRGERGWKWEIVQGNVTCREMDRNRGKGRYHGGGGKWCSGDASVQKNRLDEREEKEWNELVRKEKRGCGQNAEKGKNESRKRDEESLRKKRKR